MGRQLALVLVLCCACDRVLAIEEATIDPELTRTADPCGAYCDVVLENCRDRDLIYDSRDQCLSACASLPVGQASATTGDNLWCRLHAAKLASEEPGFYCPIAGAAGGGVCSDGPDD